MNTAQQSPQGGGHIWPQHVGQATEAIARRWKARPQIGLILGTGLGGVAEMIELDQAIPYQDLPHFPRSTALSHKGQLICGRLGEVPVVAMEGRCHLYEGYRLDQILLPVRVMQALGVELLIVSNASGGLNHRFAAGDIMVIEDHLDLMGKAAVSTNQAHSPSLSNSHGRPIERQRTIYDPALIDAALAVARRESFAAHRGVYIGVSGPNYETRAEYRMFRRIGGDAVGMSTVPETTEAARLGMRVLALSAVTNLAKPDAPKRVDPLEVIAIAQSAEPKLRAIVASITANQSDKVNSP